MPSDRNGDKRPPRWVRICAAADDRKFSRGRGPVSGCSHGRCKRSSQSRGAALIVFAAQLAPYDFSGITGTVRTRTLEVRLGLDVGGRTVELIEVGPAHTPGDLIVHVPDARAVFAADVVCIGATPCGSVR